MSIASPETEFRKWTAQLFGFKLSVRLSKLILKLLLQGVCRKPEESGFVLGSSAQVSGMETFRA